MLGLHGTEQRLARRLDVGADGALGGSRVARGERGDDRRVFLDVGLVALRDRGRIPAKLAAVAVLELDRPESMLFLSSVAESISVLAGDSCTPAGLLVATR